MFRLINFLVVIMAFSMISTITNAQSIVLINGVPTQVTLEGEEVTSIQGTVDNHMAAYDNTTKGDFQKVPARDYNVARDASLELDDDAFTDVSGNYLKFRTGSAILSNLALNEIKDYADKLNSGQAETIVLESFYKEGDTKDKKLVENRVEACRKMFELNGIGKNLIVTSVSEGKTSTNKVQISLK